MDTTFNTQETAQATVNTNVASALTVADNGSAQRVQQLGLVHQARLAQLTRTSASVTAQYGAGSAQATAAAAVVASSQLLLARITQINQRVTLAAPAVATGGWALYGHIFACPRGARWPRLTPCFWWMSRTPIRARSVFRIPAATARMRSTISPPLA